MSYTENLAKVIKELREQQNISLCRLSDKSGVDKAVISKFEKGDREIYYETACKLLKALGKDIYIE